MPDFCLNHVREHDPDRFLLSLMVPIKHRAALWALFAFNYEVAKTREVVSETTIGLIRLQWWRDALTEIYEGKAPRKHEIVEALANVIKQHDLPQDIFNDLIYAREFDLEGVAPANVDGLINYCDYTNTPLNKLVLKIIGQDDAALREASTYYALVGVMRATPFLLQRRQIMLPQDLMAKHDVDEGGLCDFNKRENLPALIKDVLEQAKGKLSLDKSASSYLRACLKTASLYEDKMKTVNYDVYDSSMGLPPRFMALRVWLAKF